VNFEIHWGHQVAHHYRVQNELFSAGANWRPKFFSVAMEKCGRQKVSVKLFLCRETQAKIIGHHGLAFKIFAIDVIIKAVLKSSCDHFDRSTLPPFYAQRISKSSANFFVSTL